VRYGSCSPTASRQEPREDDHSPRARGGNNLQHEAVGLANLEEDVADDHLFEPAFDAAVEAEDLELFEPARFVDDLFAS